VRTSQPAQLENQDRGAGRRVHLDRGLILIAPAHSTLGYRLPKNFEEKNHTFSNPHHSELGLPTGPLAPGLRGASCGPVDNPASGLAECA
jgi:hypothetical protein